MMETHCLYRYRGWAKWVAHDDIDEFFQPLSGHPTIASVIKDLEKSVAPPISALQVCQPQPYGQKERTAWPIATSLALQTGSVLQALGTCLQ